MNFILNTVFLTILILNLTVQAQYFDHKIADLRINQIETEIGMSISRDFMSVIDDSEPLMEGETYDDGTGLMVAISIIALNENAQLPNDFNLVEAVVHHAKEQWDMTTSTNKEAYRWAVPYGYTMVFRQGPRWPVNDYVYLTLVFEMDGERHDIRSKKLPILKTW